MQANTHWVALGGNKIMSEVKDLWFLLLLQVVESLSRRNYSNLNLVNSD